MSPVPPATPYAPQDDSAAQDWSWPPAAEAEEERSTTVRPDPGRMVVDVCLPPWPHDLEWPPSAADLASVVAVSLDDDGVRQLASSLLTRPAQPRRRPHRGRFVLAALAASCVSAAASATWWAVSHPGGEMELHRRPESSRTQAVPDSVVVRSDVSTARHEPQPTAMPAVTRRVDRRDRAVPPPRTVAATSAVARPAVITPRVSLLDDRPHGLAPAPVDVALPSGPIDGIDDAAIVPANALSGAVPVELAAVPSRRASPPVVSDATPRVLDTSRPNEEPAIRALLERYGTAYSRLDARAARAVWPAVDVQALTRAFDALESQNIAFERCDVEVDGSVARAACRGTSTWVPRVGERRPRRDAREWTFRLARDGDAQWRIQSASMR